MVAVAAATVVLVREQERPVADWAVGDGQEPRGQVCLGTADQPSRLLVWQPPVVWQPRCCLAELLDDAVVA